jgi:hypothetical protein
MERITREDLENARALRKTKKRRRITFQRNFVDRVQTSSQKADELLVALKRA